MAEYYLNNKPLSDFGFVPARNNGHLALSGCFDLPKRAGNTYFDWPRENGVDAYVDENDILFESRSIKLVGYIIRNLETNVQTLQDYILTLPELSTLSCKWGTWDIRINKNIVISPINRDNAKITISFIEPQPDLSGTLPSTSLIKDIDEYSWQSFGLYIEKIDGSLDIKSYKSLDVTQNPSHTIISTGGKDKNEITISGHVIANSFDDFKTKVKSLYKLFGRSGLRKINYRERSIFCFAIDGFSISNVIIRSNTVAKFTCKLIETGKIILLDENV